MKTTNLFYLPAYFLVYLPWLLVKNILPATKKTSVVQALTIRTIKA